VSIDSTADLLFRIGADSSDAESNIQRFRAVFGKNLGDMQSDFEAWSTKMFGTLSTPAGIATAGGAVLAAGIVAAGAAAIHAADQYAHYVEEIDQASKRTGIATETLSAMKVGAESTGVSFDTLTRGLGLFEVAVGKANQSEATRVKLAGELHVSTQQVADGEKNIIPLLEAVMDNFKNSASAVDRATMARQAFGRSGLEMQAFLGGGSEAMRLFAERAKELGVVIGQDDVRAVRENKLAVVEWKEELEGVEIAIGRHVLPSLTAMVEMTLAGAKTLFSWKGAGEMLAATTGNIGPLMATFATNVGEIDAHIKGIIATMKAGGDGAELAATPKKTMEAYRGLSDLLDQIKEKMIGTEEGQAAAEAARLWAEALQRINEAKDKFLKAHPSDTKAQGMFDAEMADAQEAVELIPVLYQQMVDKITAKRSDALAKKSEQISAAGTMEMIHRLAADQQAMDALDKRLHAEAAITVEGQKAAFNAKMDQMDAEYQVKADYETKYAAKIAEVRKAGLEKIDRDAAAAFATEMSQLQGRLSQIEKTHETSQERIENQYAVDVEKYDAAEEKKTLEAKQSNAQRALIAQQYAAIRAALLKKEGTDLQTLHNSQGWQGIFGAEFAATIKRDEELSKEWADSQQRSHLAVRMSLESLKEMAQDTFGAMAQGEASAIMGAIVYGKNVKQAMEEAAKGVLASLAAQAAVKAIFALAEAAVMAATGDEAGAAQELEAAALYGSVAAASAIAGRAIPSGQGGGAGAAGGGGGYRSSSGAGASTGSGSGADMGTAANMGGKHVTVNVYGHIYGTSGVAEFAGLLNDAVLNGDVPLTATNTKTGVQVIR
jgi:hypothetical protein